MLNKTTRETRAASEAATTCILMYEHHYHYHLSHFFACFCCQSAMLKHYSLPYHCSISLNPPNAKTPHQWHERMIKDMGSRSKRKRFLSRKGKRWMKRDGREIEIEKPTHCRNRRACVCLSLFDHFVCILQRIHTTSHHLPLWLSSTMKRILFYLPTFAGAHRHRTEPHNNHVPAFRWNLNKREKKVIPWEWRWAGHEFAVLIHSSMCLKISQPWKPWTK